MTRTLVTTLSIAPLSTDLSWYTSERKPTLNISWVSSGAALAASARLGLGAIAALGGLGAFCFWVLERFGSGRLVVSIRLHSSISESFATADAPNENQSRGLTRTTAVTFQRSDRKRLTRAEGDVRTEFRPPLSAIVLFPLPQRSWYPQSQDLSRSGMETSFNHHSSIAVINKVRLVVSNMLIVFGGILSHPTISIFQEIVESEVSIQDSKRHQ